MILGALLAFEVNGESVGSAVVFGGLLAVVISVATDKRRRDFISLLEGMYAAKEKEVEDLKTQKDAEIETLKIQVADLTSRVSLYESDFTKKLAEGITEAILTIFEKRMAEDMAYDEQKRRERSEHRLHEIIHESPQGEP